MKRRSLAWLDEERPTHLLGLMRIGFALLMFVQAAKAYLAYRRNGYFFGDVFHLPILPDAWVPSRSVYLGLLGVQALAAVFAILGVLGRKAMLTASLVGLYLLCANRLDYHNNRYALYLCAFLLAFAPCDRSFSVEASQCQNSKAPVWAVRFLGLQVSLIYLASGLGKLFDGDWRGGQVLHVRYERAIEYLAGDGLKLPEFLEAPLRSHGFAEFTSKGAIFTELFLAIGLWLGPTRALALWVGLLFHVGIQLGAHVDAFSYLMLTAYLAFVVPEQHERELVYDPLSPKALRLVRVVHALDWLRRFHCAERSSERARVEAYYAVERDGSVHPGLRSWVVLCRGLPLLFPLWAPLAAITWLFSGSRSKLASNAQSA